MNGETAVLQLLSYHYQQLGREERLCVVGLYLLEMAREEQGGGVFADPGLPYLTGLDEEVFEACMVQLQRHGWIRRTRAMRATWANFNQP